jgi:hypothetical protein
MDLLTAFVWLLLSQPDKMWHFSMGVFGILMFLALLRHSRLWAALWIPAAVGWPIAWELLTPFDSEWDDLAVSYVGMTVALMTFWLLAMGYYIVRALLVKSFSGPPGGRLP